MEIPVMYGFCLSEPDRSEGELKKLKAVLTDYLLSFYIYHVYISITEKSLKKF